MGTVRQLLLKMINLLSFVFPFWAIFTFDHGQATTTTITSTTITSTTATTTTPSTTITTSTTSGTLQSPNFPNKYPNNHDETYNIEVQTGKTIEIIFETFELEAHSRCSWDWLKIIDGSTTLLEETCGSNVPAKLLSQTNKVEIIFHSDYVVPKRGFKLQWKASIKNYCRTNVKDALDVAKLPECCNDVDTLLDYGGCCKDIFDGKEEACYIDPKHDTRSVSRSSSRYSTYSIYWCQSKILKVLDLQTHPICCLNPFISGKFKEDPEFIRQCCTKFDLCNNRIKRAFGVSGTVCQISYCPYKMRQPWFKKFKDCCFHPVRKYLPKSYRYLYTAECNTLMG